MVLCLLVLIFLKGNHFILFIICIVFHTPTRLCHATSATVQSICTQWLQKLETGGGAMYYSFKVIRIRILELLHKIGQNFSFSKTNFCLLLSPFRGPINYDLCCMQITYVAIFEVQFITVLLKHSSNNIWFLDIVRKVFLIEITLKFHRNFNRHHCT